MITNKLKLAFDYAALDEHFEIFELSSKKIKFDTSSLNNDMVEIKGISFVKSGIAHILVELGAISLQKLANLLDDFVIKKVKSSTLNSNELFNLLLRSLNYEGYNNLAGKLYISHPDNLKIKDKEIIGFDALEISLDENNLLCLNARQFTLLSKLNDKAKALPMYSFCQNSLALKRVYKQDKEVYVKKPLKNKKGQIDFLNVGDYKEFCASKVGIFYELLEKFKNTFGKFVSIELENIDGFEKITLSKAQQNEYESDLKQLLKGKIALINTLDNDALKVVDYAFKELEIEYELLNAIDPNKLNLVLIRPKDEYKNELDPYKIEPKTQHLCISNKDKKIHKAILQTALKELIIKDDLNKQKITLYKDKIESMSFISWFDDDLNSVYEMEINSDLSFEIRNIVGEEILEYEKYFKTSLGAIKYKNDINIISNSNIIAITPSQIRTVLKEKYENFTLTKDEFEKALSLCPKNPANIILENSNTKNIDTKSIREIISSFAPAHKSKIDEAFRLACGHGIIGAVRGKAQKERYLSGLIDLNYKNINQNELYYTIGVKSTALQANFATANHIKIVFAPKNSKIFFQDYLALLKVFFVKNEGATILPFAFKYIREFHKLKKACPY